MSEPQKAEFNQELPSVPDRAGGDSGDLSKERQETGEVLVEKQAESQEAAVPSAESGVVQEAPIAGVPTVSEDVVPSLTPEEEHKMIESILEADLADIFFKMPPQDQQAFKVKGEETTQLITKMIHQPKVRIKKVLDLIRQWLLMVPGINKFFLEQSAKIKADKIIETIPNKEGKVIE